MTKQSFMKGAMILLIAGIINRLLGFVPRIALPRIIGAEGVGIYQLGYPFLSVMLTIVIGGIPLAVAKWIAEAESQGDHRRVKHIFRTAMLLTVSLSLALTLLLLLFAPLISSHVLPDARVYQTFLCMTPLVIIIGISSVYRAYFQGMQNMIPTAVSQVTETIIRIIIALVLAAALLPFGLQWAAAGAMLGTVAGEIAGLAVTLYHYRKERRSKRFMEASAEAEANDQPNVNKHAWSKRERPTPVLQRLLKISVPVTASRLVGSLSYLFETILTNRSLAAAGIVVGVATSQYGALQGMVVPLILLPTALTYSLSVSLIPSLSEAAARDDYALIQKRLLQSLRLSLVSGAPFVVIMTLFAEPLCRLIYNHPDIAPMLQLIAPFGLFIYLQGPFQAALQALDKPGTALLNTFIGAVIKLILIVQLASKPELGIYGAAIAICVNIAIVTALHGWSVARSVGFRLPYLDYIKVCAAMTVMGAFALWLMNNAWLPHEALNVMLASFGGLMIYLVIMMITGIINRSDLPRLPLIGRLFKS
ncbi:stage V sporulation protein B [Paenibacillus curdlanolyticus YK9]|uniref:Stage V sporulation protein B n=1 Tax=Paenibacillus curdlanolyticus YK9 TaxID=717606 RepID=E0IDY0_9BACL|nr:stage V sporulation protein B [Paenibacillus curdlanolyticus]EFM09334.1 stage V sporulation protein B [Paenibacillus curdlanolyticus YK9]